MNYYMILNKYKKQLTAQQYRTFKGQIKAGDYEGFLKGLEKILNRR